MSDIESLIEQLAREAGAVGGEHKIMDRASLAVFAELIAEECIRIFENNAADDSYAFTAIRERFKSQ